MMSTHLWLALLVLQATPSPLPIIMPPLAANFSGQPEQVLLGPIFRAPYTCSEHWQGAIPYAGDALGTDCLLEDGVEGRSGYMRPFRTDGRSNSDWYVWHADVLAPISGTVVGALVRPAENQPGTMGRPPANMLQIRTQDGLIVSLGHFADLNVSLGDTVETGQVVGRAGNNGMSRSPHVHVGAWRESDAVPFQIRWDLLAAGRVFRAAGTD